MILGYPAELCLVELVVRALFCHQFVVGSLLENLSVVDHKIRSAFLIVERRCAMMNEVRPFNRLSIPCCT